MPQPDELVVQRGGEGPVEQRVQLLVGASSPDVVDVRHHRFGCAWVAHVAVEVPATGQALGGEGSQAGGAVPGRP
ncbi:MAG: hypothetical protein GEV09_08630 [Pseudonocardiaceae bacterium]|nr:hypothetical protein [Pseudonocardiaceae bacterium]